MQWPWKSLGEEVERARRDCVPRGKPGHDEAAQRFHRALDAAWPPGFFEQLKRCKRGDPAGLDDVFDFVETCPRFFRTGYVLGMALRWLPRPPRTSVQTERIQGIVLAAVSGRLWLPFRRIPSLARAVDSPGLRGELRALRESQSGYARARAAQVLDRLSGPPWDPDRARKLREQHRIGGMLVTAIRGKSAVLLRRILAIDPGPLTSRARHHLAVAFEAAMNRGLIPDDELLEAARRIDGPEMAGVWTFALGRPDAPGDRARWILERLRPG